MTLINYIRKILGQQKIERKEISERFQEGLIELTYEYLEEKNELTIYLYFDADIDLKDATIVPINDYELVIVTREQGVIALLKLKKPYFQKNVILEKKQKTIKIKLFLKKGIMHYFP